MDSAIKREGFLFFILLAFIFAYFYQDGGWNGNSRMGLTFAIVQERHLTIDSFHNQAGSETGDKAIYKNHYYSDKAIGLSIIAAAFYYPTYLLEQLLHIKPNIFDIKYLLTFLSVGLPSALAGSLMYVLSRQISGKKFRAFAAALSIVLGTMILPYSVTFFSHVTAGALLFVTFFLIFQIKAAPPFRLKALFFLIGLLLGTALITEYTIAPIALVLALYYLFIVFKTDVGNRGLAVILPALAGCIPIAIFLAYNMKVYGSPFSIGYQHEFNFIFRQAHAQDFMGIGWPDPKVMFYLTAHPAMGIFWQSPVLILSLIGLWFMWRAPDYRIEAGLAFAAFLALFLINSGYYMWWGGRSFGPRHLIPMLPFLGLPLVFLPRRWFYGVVPLGIISITQMFIVLLSKIEVVDEFFYHIAQSSFFAYSSIYNDCLKLLLNGYLSTNIINKIFGINTWLSLVPFLLGLLVILWLFFAKRDQPKRAYAG